LTWRLQFTDPSITSSQFSLVSPHALQADEAMQCAPWAMMAGLGLSTCGQSRLGSTQKDIKCGQELTEALIFLNEMDAPSFKKLSGPSSHAVDSAVSTFGTRQRSLHCLLLPLLLAAASAACRRRRRQSATSARKCGGRLRGVQDKKTVETSPKERTSPATVKLPLTRDLLRPSVYQCDITRSGL
jgi:hypothetical protein